MDGTIVPTIDAPEFGYTRETTDELYCPDVFYREKDEYGNSVTKIGRPLPIEYLLTDVNYNCILQNINFYLRWASISPLSLRILFRTRKAV